MTCQGCNREKKVFSWDDAVYSPPIKTIEDFQRLYMQDPTVFIEYAKNHANDRRNKGSTE